MIIAGFDLATVSGCAVLSGTTVLHVEAFRSTGASDGEVFRNFRRWFRGIIVKNSVAHVAIEQPLVTNIRAPDPSPRARPGATINPINMKTYLRLYGFRAHAVELCVRLGIPYHEVHQSTWRRAFTGNGKASKADALALAQRLVPDLKSLDAAEAIGIAWWLNGELRSAHQA